MKSAAESAYQWIREEITTGRFRPEGRLPEEVLAAETGLSRTPIREALRRLHAEGFVEVRPNRGARVAAWSLEESDDLFALRVQLESLGARLAAQRATSPEAVKELSNLARQMICDYQQYGRAALPAIAEANIKFHRLVLELSENPRLIGVVGGLMEMSLVYRTFHQYSHRGMVRSLAHHRELVEAVVARDPDWAESVMRAHLQAGRAELRAYEPGLGSEGN